MLTPEQRAIVGRLDASILIEAVAGSGKTTTLAHCIAHRVRQGLAPDAVLTLIFSRAAQRVFQQRLRQADAPAGIDVCTYADLARRLLDDWRDQGAIDGAAHRIDTVEALRPYVFDAIETAAEHLDADPDYRYDLNNLHAEGILNHLSRLKGTLALRRLADAGDDELAEEWDLPRGLVAIFRAYERQREIEHGSYAFQAEQDLVYDALNLLAVSGPHLAVPAPLLVVADEWHDANASHAELLHRLAGPRTRLVVAGDREQVVHSWNGADPRYMGEGFSALFPDTRRMPLGTSFRCGPTLAACAGALTRQRFVSHRTDDTEVLLQPIAPRDDARALLDNLAAIRRSHPDDTLADCAVLLRAPHHSIALENALIQQGIPYLTEGFDSYLDRTEVLMLRGLLHIVAGSLAPVSQPGRVKAIVRALGLYAGLRYTEETWRTVERTLLATPDAIAYFHEGRLAQTSAAAEEMDEATRRWRTRFGAVCATLKAEVAAGNDRAGPLLAQAVEALDLAATTRRLHVVRDDARTAIRSLQAFVEHAVQTGLPIRAFLAALDTAQQRSDASRRRGHRLTLGTVRDVKGREWKHVILPFLNPGDFPDAEADPAEERRLFYVAITRASASLRLLVPDGPPNPLVEGLSLADARRAAARRDTLPLPDGRRYLDVPYGDKDEAKRLGAQWDAVQRKWWISAAVRVHPFRHWLPAAAGGENR